MIRPPQRSTLLSLHDALPIYVTPRQKVLETIEQVKEELKERLNYLRDNNKLVEAQRLEERTRFDIEMMLELGYCSGIENRSEEHTSELQSQSNLVCRLLLEKK